jgi:glutathione S-transferase
MYRLFTANRNYSSWSLRVWLLMRALGIPFDDVIRPFAGNDNFDAFRSFSPSGKVPCLLDGDRVVWDSLAIAEYLAERHEGVWPADDGARAWGRCAAAEMHSGFGALRSGCPMNVGVRARRHSMTSALDRDVARLGELWAEGLTRFGGPFLAGQAFTAVDAFFSPVVFRVRTFDLDVGGSGRGWASLMLDHPAMREWEAAALAETREGEHEAELAACGTVIADHRAAAPG